MPPRIRTIATLLLLVLVTGCGGSGGDAGRTSDGADRADRAPGQDPGGQAEAPAETIPNPWTTPFSELETPPAVLDDSGELVADLVRQRQYGMGIEQRRWTTPLYVVRSDEHPKVRVEIDSAPAPVDPRTGADDPAAILNFLARHGVDGEGWPIPPWAIADPSETGEDGHLAVLVEDTGQYLELNDARKQPDGSWKAGWGGYIADVAESPGRFVDRHEPTLAYSDHGWGANASSLPLIGGLILDSEIRAAYAAYRKGDMDRAVIPHALGLNVHAHSQYGWVWPAQRTDCYGKGGCPFEVGPIDMGQTFRFPDDFDPASIKGATERETALLQILARTIQRYGTIVWDQSGGGFKLRAQLLPNEPMFQYGRTAEWLKSLPIDKLVAVDPRPGTSEAAR